MSELPLIQAAKLGDLKLVRELLAAGHDVNERGEPINEQEMKAAKWLLNEAGVETAVEAMGRTIDVTPLMAAIEAGHANVAEALLDARADVNLADSFLRTALMIAIGRKQDELVRRLLAAGADPNAKDRTGDPVLTQAIQAGLWHTAHALLDAGANAAPRGKADCMPLACASPHRGEEAAALINRLLDLGAKPGKSFLPILVSAGNHALVGRTLRDFAKHVDPQSHAKMLESAAKQRDLPLIQMLLQHGILPKNSVDERSPLTGVIIGPPRSSLDSFRPKYIDDERETACLDALVAAGANINHASGNQPSPLVSTISFCRSGLCRWLLDHGADTSVTDYGKSLVDSVRERIARLRLDDEDEECQAEERCKLDELKKILAMLLEADSGQLTKVAAAPVSKTSQPKRRQSRLQQSVDAPSQPIAERRGMCDASFSKAEQIMIRANIDAIADLLENDKTIERVERDVFDRLAKFKSPTDKLIALIQLKGQQWVYLHGVRSQGDAPMKAWSKTLQAPVLCAGEQSTAGVVYYSLFDCGECVESFESDGIWFRGGVEIDPEVQDEADRMVGTDFYSKRRQPAEVHWSDFESEFEFLDKFVRAEEAYLTFVGVSSQGKGKRPELWAYHKEEAAADAVERVDLAFAKA